MTKMFERAKKAGVASESKMWSSVAAMAPALAILKAEHPDDYWSLMRNQHEILWGPHYDEDFAEHDVTMLRWTDKDGMTHSGPHWSKEQVVDATAGMNFPGGTTDCDKYVAMNSFYADLCKDIDDGMIIKLAHRYFFGDEDAPQGKIWRYMKTMMA